MGTFVMSRLNSLIRQDGASNEPVKVRRKESAGDKVRVHQKASSPGSRLDRLMQQSAKSFPLKRGCSSESSTVKRHCDRLPQKAKCTVLPDKDTGVESDDAHKFRHPTFDASCPRCGFLKYGSRWMRLATWKHLGICRTWLAPKPVHMGGQ